MTQLTEKDFWVQMSIMEIQSQIEYAEIAYSHIDEKAQKNNKAIFSSIHSFLSHCAIVSKMLKACDDSDKSKLIGNLLDVPITSLIHKRAFRNNLEHYDRELRAWIKKYGVGCNIGTNNIGPKSMIALPRMVFVSHYDPETKEFTFVNEVFNLEKMFNEVEKIKLLSNKWMQKRWNREIVPPFI